MILYQIVLYRRSFLILTLFLIFLVWGLEVKIKKNIYNMLINCHQVPPELGGLLLGTDSIIDLVVFDSGINNNSDGIRYVPNTIFLNKCLLIYSRQEKKFWGMFHTHACQWDSLSNSDIQYIETIMRAMSVEKESLYFPIVFPGNTVKSYKAKNEGAQIIIVNDKIEII